MSEGTPSDRRRHQRFDLIAHVRVKRGRVDYVMELTNISRSGALVDMGTLDRPKWVSLDGEVEIGIIHPESLDIVPLTGKIVRVQRVGDSIQFAVTFIAPDEHAAELDGLIAYAQATSQAPPPTEPPAGPPPLPQT